MLVDRTLDQEPATLEPLVAGPPANHRVLDHRVGHLDRPTRRSAPGTAPASPRGQLRPYHSFIRVSRDIALSRGDRERLPRVASRTAARGGRTGACTARARLYARRRRLPSAGKRNTPRRSCCRRRGSVDRVLSRPARATGMGEVSIPDLSGNRGGRLPRGPVDGLDARIRPADGGAYRYYDVGLEHLAFEVDRRDEVDEAHARCLSRGARIHFPPEEDRDVDDYYAVFIFDPDGIRVEVFCWSRPDAAR